MKQTAQDLIVKAARNEITEHHIYARLARRPANPHNRQILERLAETEKAHYDLWVRELGRQLPPSEIKIWWYTTIASLLGLSFGLRLMERGEKAAQKLYQELAHTNPIAVAVMRDEQQHEEKLLTLINEHFLQYVSSFVLGLNDALVELTGALTGLTLALQNTRLIAVVGLITGIAASLAMAASEYLSTKEENNKDAWRAGLTTGIAYFITVVLLIAPYFIFTNVFTALMSTLAIAVLIIFVFTFYTAFAKGLPFKKRFFEMAVISLGVAAINFGIGFAIKRLLDVEV